MITAIQYLRSLNEVCQFHTNGQGYKKASNSELGRWLKDKSVRINGLALGPMDPIPLPITSVVLFPKSPQRKCTIL
jgi:hypothetical protein